MTKRDSNELEQKAVRKRTRFEYAEFTLFEARESFLSYIRRMEFVLASRLGLACAENCAEFEYDNAEWWHVEMSKWGMCKISPETPLDSVARYVFNKRKFAIVYALADDAVAEQIDRTTELGEILAGLADDLMGLENVVDPTNPRSMESVGIMFILCMLVLAHFPANEEAKRIVDAFVAQENNNDDDDKKENGVTALVRVAKREKQ